MKNTWEYRIMHKDRTVAALRGDGSCRIFFPSFLPYSLYLEAVASDSTDVETKVNNLQNFYYFCSSRVLSVDRKYAKEILNGLRLKQAVTDKDRAEIALSYHALTLTDSYWVKEKGEKISFSDINLYEHSLSNAMTDVCLRGKNLTLTNGILDKNETAGNLSVAGVAAKAWIRKSDGIYLLKGGERRDVEAELLASKILDCFAVEHVRYAEAYFDGEKVTESRLVTSPQRSIVAMEFIEIFTANHGRDWFDFTLKKSPYEYYMMNIVDYLVGNTDRHWGNWGFWINEKNKAEKLYPLMDFNKAFLSYDAVEGAPCQTVPNRMTQKEAALLAIRKIGLNQIKEIDPEWFFLPSLREMFFKRLSLLKEQAAR